MAQVKPPDRAVSLVLIALLAAGCGAAAASPRHARVRPQTYADTACPDVLANLPAAPPRTAAQATADIAGLQDTATTGTLLASLANTVSADLLNLSFDLDGSSGNASSDLAKYQTDVAQVRSYCKPVHG